MSIGYVSPEAALASPLSAVKDGDTVEIDIKNRRINMLVDDEEIKRRIAAFNWEFDGGEYHKYLNLFVKNVSSMAKGGIWE